MGFFLSKKNPKPLDMGDQTKFFVLLLHLDMYNQLHLDMYKPLSSFFALYLPFYMYLFSDSNFVICISTKIATLEFCKR